MERLEYRFVNQSKGSKSCTVILYGMKNLQRIEVKAVLSAIMHTYSKEKCLLYDYVNNRCMKCCLVLYTYCYDTFQVSLLTDVLTDVMV